MWEGKSNGHLLLRVLGQKVEVKVEVKSARERDSSAS